MDFLHRLTLTSLINTKQQQSDSCYMWLPSSGVWFIALLRMAADLESPTEVCLSEILAMIYPSPRNPQAIQSWPCLSHLVTGHTIPHKFHRMCTEYKSATSQECTKIWFYFITTSAFLDTEPSGIPKAKNLFYDICVSLVQPSAFI